MTAWEAYERVEGPLGPQRQDILTALLAAVVASLGRSDGGEPPKLEDFLLKWDAVEELPPEQDVNEQVRLAEEAAIAFGGTVKKGVRE